VALLVALFAQPPEAALLAAVKAAWQRVHVGPPMLAAAARKAFALGCAAP
jgi:hypothetical protein